MPLLKRLAALPSRDYPALARLSARYSRLQGRYKLYTRPFATKSESKPSDSVRLACVKRTASVHPEL